MQLASSLRHRPGLPFGRTASPPGRISALGRGGHAMGGPRSFYLLASTILAIGVGMAFMDDSDTVDRASRHATKPSVQAAPPSTRGVPASRDRAIIGDPEPERRTEVA